MFAKCNGQSRPARLLSALDESEWSASSSSYFTPRTEPPPGTNWIRGLLGARAGLDSVPYRESNPGYLDRSLSLHRLSYPGSLNPYWYDIMTTSLKTHTILITFLKRKIPFIAFYILRYDSVQNRLPAVPCGTRLISL
jgi:hypothetical protein